MAKILVKLTSGGTQERELVTAFKIQETKYYVFDGESTGSMGYPIVLVGKDNFGKIVGITEVDEWKSVKDVLKKIIAGEKVDYTSISNEVNADDIYYRQLTLPIESFDVLKKSYVVPEGESDGSKPVDTTPIFEPITPEDVINTNVGETSEVVNEPVAPNNEVPAAENPVFSTEPVLPNVFENQTPEIVPTNEAEPTLQDNNENSKYDSLKANFLKKAEELFDQMYEEFNHND